MKKKVSKLAAVMLILVMVAAVFTAVDRTAHRIRQRRAL